MNPMDALREVFASIVQEMPQEFDSHQFILKLAQQHQQLYVRALAEQVVNTDPFRRVHGQISQSLGARTDLVQSLGKIRTPDIFGELSDNAKWRKI